MMLAYPDAPQWWYGIVLVLAAAVGLICIYQADSGLPWWAFFVAIGIATICILFFGSQYAMTGFHVPVQPLIQMIGAYLNPGKPLTSMYFTLFGYNTVVQGYYMLSDLKLGQYAKLPPRATFTMQMIGTIMGAIMNYVMMLSITTNQREILLSIEGTNIWSGAQIQSFNTQAVSWGGLAKQMYSVGTGRYQWVPLAFLIGFIAPLPFYFAHRLWPKLGFNYWNVAIIVWHLGYLCTGINSSLTSVFILAFWSQLYLRKYKPEWFLKYNYVLCAGLDGGTQVIVFILSFAVFGSSGKPIPFPGYWGNRPKGNIDYCMRAPS
jgi:OPT family oligopeptide transporter